MANGPVQKGHATAALVLGIIEVICGLIIIILSVVLAGKANVGASMSPYWAGIVFAIPGIIGIVVGITKNHCGMIAFMVLNIIAFILQGVGAILVGLIIAVWATIVADATKNCTKSGYRECTCSKDGSSFKLNDIDDCDLVTTIASMAIGIVVLLVIAAVVTLAASILGCIAVCCSNNNGGQPGTVIIQQGNAPLHQQPPPYSNPNPVKY